MRNKIILTAMCIMAISCSPSMAEDMPCHAIQAIPKESRQVPTEEWRLYKLPLSQLQLTCHNMDATACSYKNKTGPWNVLVPNDYYSDAELACVIEYEKAHLPPNYWGDPKIETPAVIKWLSEMKAKNHD